MSEPNQTFPLVAFDPSEAHIQAYRSEIAAVVKEAAQFNLVADAQLPPETLAKFKAPKRELVRLRNQIDNGRKAMNADALAYQRSVNSAAAKYIGLMTQDEDILNNAIEKHERAERAVAEAKVRAEVAREAAEAKRIADELAALKAEERKREEAERAAERKKLADERAAFWEEKHEAEEARRKHQAEIDRVGAEERARIAQERQEEAERRAAEDAERAKEKAAIDAQARQVREEQEKLDRAKFERETAERLAESARIRAERDAQEKTDREKAAAIRAEADRIEAEKQAAEEKRAEELGRSDREKIQFAGAAIFFPWPEGLTTVAAKTFAKQVMADLEDIRERCKNYGKKPGKAKVQA